MYVEMCVTTLAHQELHPSWPQDLLIDPPATNGQFPHHLSLKHKDEKGLPVSGAIESPKQAQESTRPVQQDDLTKTSASPHHTRMFDASVHRASKLAARLGILPSCACTSVRN